MSEVIDRQVSVLDLEPTWEEILDMASFEASIECREFKDHIEWIDFCCMVENYIRRERGLI